MSTEHSGPSSMLVFVRSSKETGGQPIKAGPKGPILWADGDFLKELQEGCGDWDISDRNVPAPENGQRGLLMFVGWIEVSVGDDPDVHWEGWWRQLSMWELAKLRFGEEPYGKSTPVDEVKLG